MKLHESLRPGEGRKPISPIQVVCIGRDQNPTPETLKGRMGNDAFHQPLRQPASAIIFQHKDVAKICDRRTVGDYACKPDLPVPMEHAETQCMLDRACDDFTRNPSRPLRFECKKVMDGLNLQAIAVGGYFKLAALPLNDLHVWTRAVHAVQSTARGSSASGVTGLQFALLLFALLAFGKDLCAHVRELQQRRAPNFIR